MYILAILAALALGYIFLIYIPKKNKIKAQISHPIPYTEFVYKPIETETLALINQYRTGLGLNPLITSNYLSLMSETHNKEMIVNSLVSHNGFSNRSDEIITLFDAKSVSENLAYNYKSAQSALTAWIKSPEHLENIVGDFTHFGISVIPDSSGKNYYTNLFMKK
jgi:uncharacterized protein YkwD